MTAPTIGSLCSGYGGLDLAVEEFFGAETAWFAEYEAAPSKVLAHHWPTVPNLGDMTAIDWLTVEPVDIVTGGTPCQDLSAAGRRRGMTEGTRSNLWVQMRECIAAVRPSVVVWENVRGAYSACADSEVGQCPGCVDKSKQHRPFLRALGRVLGDLSDLGFDAEVVGVRASDAGAPHQRFRVFVVAYAEGVGYGNGGSAILGGVPAAAVAGDLRAAADADDDGRPRVWRVEHVERDADGRRRAVGDGLAGEPAAPADSSSDARCERDGDDVRAGSGTVGRAPTPGTSASAVTSNIGHERAGCTRVGWSGSPDHGGSAGHSDVAGLEGRAVRGECAGERTAGADGVGTQWGPYEPAIRRWERVLGRVAPAPTNSDGKGGAHRLAPEFVEWMMGLDEGHVTAPEIGLTRNEMLKALGNGVVRQQARLALSIAWPRLADVREQVAA